jgi:agmatinase
MRPEVEEKYFWPRRTFAALTPPLSDYASAGAVVLPIPYDATASANTVGTREGPQAIIDASQDLELLDLELGFEPASVGIHTLPELAPQLGSPEQMQKAIREVTGELLRDGKMVVALGGEHSVTIGLAQAHAERYNNLGFLSLDAHGDLRDEYLGTKYSHACVGRRLLELGPLVQVGIRSASLEEAPTITDRRNAGFLLAMDDIRDNGSWLGRAIAALPENVYVSVDLDVFDPSVMAAVDLPEPGGLLWHEVIALLRLIGQERHIVGCDIVELAPREGPRACTFLAAKLAYKLIGFALANRVLRPLSESPAPDA